MGAGPVSQAAFSAFKTELGFSQLRKERLRVENDCSPAILWDLPFLCFFWAMLFCDFFAAMGLHRNAFGEDFKSPDVMETLFLILCCMEGDKMASHSFTLGLRLIS